jgi:hypothetical protein
MANGVASGQKTAGLLAAVVLSLLVLAVYDSSNADTQRAEARLQTKVSAALRRVSQLEEDAKRAHAMSRKYANAEMKEYVKMGSESGQALYDVPSFTEERTRMHFPQAEAGWLNMAAAGQLGDDVKTDDEQGNLTAIIDEWKDRAKAEKDKAYEDAAIFAREDNYEEYNITKGVANHKVFKGKQPGAAPQLKGAKGPAPKLAAKATPKLAVAAGRGVASLAHRKSGQVTPARIRAEEQHMQRVFAKEAAAAERIKRLQAKMKSSLHLAEVKLAHQEAGHPARRGPAAERDKARTQSLGELGVGPESDHVIALQKAGIVGAFANSNTAPSGDTIDEVNEAIASQRADGYSNGEGKAVEDITLSE